MRTWVLKEKKSFICGKEFGLDDISLYLLPPHLMFCSTGASLVLWDAPLFRDQRCLSITFPMTQSGTANGKQVVP